MEIRFRVSAILLIIMFFMYPILSASAICGDSSEDGITNIIDALLIAQCYVGLTSCPAQEVGDVNCDSNINIIDALLISQYYVGILAELDCCSVKTPTPTPGVTDIPTQSPDQVNLLQNSDFNTKGYWRCLSLDANNNTNSECKMEIVNENGNNVAMIEILNRRDNPWDVSFQQSMLNMRAGVEYTVRFSAKVSNTNMATIEISATRMGPEWGGVWETYSGDYRAFTITNNWQDYMFTFTMPQDDDQTRFDINLGRPRDCSNPPDSDTPPNTDTTVSQSNSFIIYLDDITFECDSQDYVAYKALTIPADYQTPYSRYGRLQVLKKTKVISNYIYNNVDFSGTYINDNLCDASGNSVQLKGMSSHGVQWHQFDYMNKEALKQALLWGADVMRVAMYLGQDGYIENPGIKYNVMRSVNDIKDLGMYAIIDWHVHEDAGDPLTYQSQASDFFQEISQIYSNDPQVVFEICNEPVNTGWSNIKQYAEAIIPVIRQNCPDNIIIVGTPTWSQDVDVASYDSITGQSNILYAFHFYAATHGLDSYGQKVRDAMLNGLGIFVSEFGTTSSSGSGSTDTFRTDLWMDFMDRFNISWVNWSFCYDHSQKQESAILQVKGSVYPHPIPLERNGWDNYLTTSGNYIKNKLGQ